MADELKYWFNQNTKQVEKGPKSLALSRLGPFDSFEEAQKAEEIVLERARRLREEDRSRWEDED